MFRNNLKKIRHPLERMQQRLGLGGFLLIAIPVALVLILVEERVRSYFGIPLPPGSLLYGAGAVVLVIVLWKRSLLDHEDQETDDSEESRSAESNGVRARIRAHKARRRQGK